MSREIVHGEKLRFVGFAKHFGPASVREWARPAKGSAKATPVGMAGGGLAKP